MGPIVLTLALVAGLGVLAGPSLAQTNPQQLATGAPPPGATVESVLVVVRQLSPERAVRALELQAAQARVVIAGALPDPTLRVTSDEIDRLAGPRQNKMTYSVEQDVPLWGKRDLRRQAAQSEAVQMAAQVRDTDSMLAEKAKIGFAEYYTAYHAVRRIQAVRGTVQALAQAAQERYALARGGQTESLQAELALTRLATEVVRQEAGLRGAQGQLNALLLRPLDAPLAPPQRLRSSPAPAKLELARLAQRAGLANPGIAGGDAAISAAEANRRLAERSLYPDATFGAAAIDRTGNGPNGYMAWVGVKVPLQWGAREAQVREATAQAGAARARREALEQQILGGLAQAVAAFQGSRRTADLLRHRNLPQADALVRSSAAGYTQGKVEMIVVLQAAREQAELFLQLLNAELDMQRQLASIERLIGEDL